MSASRGLALVLVAISIALASYSGASNLMPTVSAGTQDLPPIIVASAALFIWATPLLGGLLAIRRPSNAVGWLFILMSLGMSAGFASDDLAHHAEPSALVAGLVTIGQQVGALGYVSLFLLLMVFPTGTLPGRAWRALPVAALAGLATVVVAGFLEPGSPVDPPVSAIQNPFAVPGLRPLVDALSTVSLIAFLTAAIGALLLLVVRVRRSGDVERQQLKWFVSAGALTALLFIGVMVVTLIAPEAALANALWSLPVASLVLIPLAATVAILRFRLYDIDRIISRTVAYTIVTGLLAACYGAAFVGLQALLAPFVENDGLLVAGSTLVVFALFAPLRRRISSLVDRRFNRARYDAEREAEAFAARVRDEVDAALVARALEAVLGRTVQPASAAIWLRSVEPG